ncbi:MAG: MBL fold metallo-hydrolase [Clostridia bacterium]|nr:MBL fold metallo-hydrolase [Clostridia bacterium]
MEQKPNVKKGKKLIISILSAVIVLVLTLLSEQLLSLFEPLEVNNSKIDSEFSVHFIDVGQGDCTLIKTPDGNMLIDAGENGYETTVLDYLEAQGVDSLKYFVATHPHSDHIGGAAEVLEAVSVENVIMPKLSKDNTPATATYEKMLTAIKNSSAKAISAKPGSEYSFGGAEFTVLAPFEQDENLNNMSVVLKLTYKGYSFMLSGDAEKEVENRILKAGYDISADVYKGAHHGSSTSNSKKFVKAINPTYAVLSYEEGNSYGHPHRETVELFNEEGIVYYSTADYGTIVFTVDNSILDILTVKNDTAEVTK